MISFHFSIFSGHHFFSESVFSACLFFIYSLFLPRFIYHFRQTRWIFFFQIWQSIPISLSRLYKRSFWTRSIAVTIIFFFIVSIIWNIVFIDTIDEKKKNNFFTESDRKTRKRCYRNCSYNALRNYFLKSIEVFHWIYNQPNVKYFLLFLET